MDVHYCCIADGQHGSSESAFTVGSEERSTVKLGPGTPHPSHAWITQAADPSILQQPRSVYDDMIMEDLEDELDMRCHKGLHPDVHCRCPNFEVIYLQPPPPTMGPR